MQFWIALGFQAPDPDEQMFSQRDLEVLHKWHDLVESGAIDTATSRSLLRANSHLADRLALWQYEALVEDSSRRLMLDDTTARMYVLDHMREYIDVFQEMFVYSWRRQLEATLSRFDREVSQRGHEERHSRFPLNRCLGFVDMVSYTSSSTILGDSLVGLIERFEEESRTAVIEEGGRVVKMIGDAVLYIADDLTTGLRVATTLIERLNADDEMLPVRASFVRRRRVLSLGRRLRADRQSGVSPRGHRARRQDSDRPRYRCRHRRGQGRGGLQPGGVSHRGLARIWPRFAVPARDTRGLTRARGSARIAA